MTSKRTLAVLFSALIGFGPGFGLLFQLSPRVLWFVLNTPGGWLFSPFVGPGASVWMIPLGNAAAYAAIAVLFVCASALARSRRRHA
jgi:hypothetical protein